MTIRTSKRRVAVITGTRADYGLLKPVMRAIDNHPRLQLQLLVTGMHLLGRFGNTIAEIESDGWRIDGRARLQGEKDDVIGHSRGLGRAITRMTDIFSRLKTELVIVLGDRLEMFAAASAASASQLVLGHIHGGDAAMGVQDDVWRFAISKLAHIHFPASDGATKRLLMLGEDRFRIYQTGSPAVDNLSKNICRNNKELSKWAGFDVCEDFLVVLQHPAGASAEKERLRMLQTLRGCRHKNLKILVLYPNCDPGFSGIIRAAQQFCSEYQFPLLKHVPRAVYLGLLSCAQALVGNSSSGIIEAGYLSVDVINVGPRQRGRDRGTNVVDVNYGKGNVAGAVEKAIRHRRRPKVSKIYGNGRSGYRIASVLARVKLDQKLRQKKIAY